MTVTYTLVLPDGRRFEMRDEGGWPDGTDPYLVEFQYIENNYSCDCNRSLFIAQQHDPTFPNLPCGETIRLENLCIDGIQIHPGDDK